MNLIIDIGNTRAKLAVFQDFKIIKSVTCLKSKLSYEQKKILNEFPKIQDGIIANVAKPQKGYDGTLSELNGKKIILSSGTSIPFNNAYGTPQSLGLDRIALAAAAVHQFPNRNTLVIDAGTCITYDIITTEKDYLGGAISPGLNMRYRALHNFTANLPLLRTADEEISALGTDTISSLKLGVTGGVVNEINGFIDQFNQKYENLTIIFTGGDSEFLSKRLKNSIFVAKNFLLTGLNCILEYNKL